MSETCPASQGRGEGYSVHTDESEGLSATCYGQPLAQGSLWPSVATIRLKEIKKVFSSPIDKAVSTVYTVYTQKANEVMV